MGNRVYVQNSRVRAGTSGARHGARCRYGQGVIWEYKFTSFKATCHRIASDGLALRPTRKPETCTRCVGATLVALAPDGKPLWHRSIGEEFAASRRTAPDDVSHCRRRYRHRQRGGVELGAQAARSHRLIALKQADRRHRVRVEPGGRPTTRPTPRRTSQTINETRC